MHRGSSVSYAESSRWSTRTDDFLLLPKPQFGWRFQNGYRDRVSPWPKLTFGWNLQIDTMRLDPVLQLLQQVSVWLAGQNVSECFVFYFSGPRKTKALHGPLSRLFFSNLSLLPPPVWFLVPVRPRHCSCRNKRIEVERLVQRSRACVVRLPVQTTLFCFCNPYSKCRCCCRLDPT